MPALDDPQTRTDLAALRAGALRWLGGGALAVVLGFVLGSAVIRIAEDGGSRVPGAGLLVVGLVLAGTAAALAGLGSLLRVRRWTAGLAREPWRSGVLRIAGPAMLHVESDDVDEPLRLRLMSTAVWRTREVQRLSGAVVRWAEVAPQEWVLSADGAGTVYGARPARRR
ncbi:hypothetical protein O2W14_14840 [Modestobacter sp. VKM Ac-2986]|uniref:hypothetical protein n=1 Tax=Modestobacter sp. VKM Ac-2986 TaxID=3004140 RepID=UPI0022ABB87B|nr:hypothetical protein [Modestobacter sp. VKM Ac-2986]MCZ2830113.1 hypothetical protein [Modestobacter sp. VKM Ac-2986]